MPPLTLRQMGPSGPMSGWQEGVEWQVTNAPHTDCFEHVQGANFVFFDGKSGYFRDRTIIRCFQKLVYGIYGTLPIFFTRSESICISVMIMIVVTKLQKYKNTKGQKDTKDKKTKIQKYKKTKKTKKDKKDNNKKRQKRQKYKKDYKKKKKKKNTKKYFLKRQKRQQQKRQKGQTKYKDMVPTGCPQGAHNGVTMCPHGTLWKEKIFC